MAYLKDKDEFKDLYDALDEEKMHKILLTSAANCLNSLIF